MTEDNEPTALDTIEKVVRLLVIGQAALTVTVIAILAFMLT